MRLTAIGVPQFQHDGLSVTTGWSTFDYSKAPSKAQDAFRTYVGRFVRIHPADVGQLSALGLALERGRIVDLKSRTRAR